MARAFLKVAFAWVFLAAAAEFSGALDYTETDILQILDRRPMDMEIFEAAPHASEIFLATSRGLISLDLRARAAHKVLREPVASVAWDGDRLVAAGSNGVWREDLGWIHPVGFDPAGAVLAPSSMGVLLVARTDLWQMADGGLIHLFYDSTGLIGPAVSTPEEISVLGFWALHRIRISAVSRAFPARPLSASILQTIDIPIPPELRADIPVGLAYLGKTLVVIGRRSGVYVLSPTDRIFPDAIPPPALDAEHLKRGFPEGWIDFEVDGDNLYLMNSDATLYMLGLGRPVRPVSGWLPLDQPYRFSILPGDAVGGADRRFLLFPPSGNFVLHAGLHDDHPRNLNFLATASGEILAREGSASHLFNQPSGFQWLKLNPGAYLIALGAAGVGILFWLGGVPGFHRLHPMASAFSDRLAKYRVDQQSLLESYQRIETELAKMKTSGGLMQTEDSRESSGERLQFLIESRKSLQESMRRFANNMIEEARRIRHEGRGKSQANAGALNRFLSRQTRAWERKYIRLGQKIESVIKESADV